MEFQILGMTVLVWQFFITLGIIFCILEMFVPGFILFPIGVAFIISALVSDLGSTWVHQIFIFSITLAVVFLLFQFLVKPRLKTNRFRTNAESMIGKEVEIVEEIRSGRRGYVKLYGDRWEAIGLDGAEFQVGDVAVIVKIDGNKVIVRSID